MGTLTANEIITRISIDLGNPEKTKWTETELLGYLNEAQRTVVLVLPESNMVSTTINLVEGTKQTLPTDGYRLLDITRNMGNNGTTPGNAVRAIERSTLDQTTPNWHTANPDSEVEQFIYDIRNRKTFYVQPPQPSSSRGSVEVIYAQIPGDVAIGDTIALDDIYQPAIVAYMMYLAYMKDSMANMNKIAVAREHLERFMTLLLGRQEVQDALLKIRNQIVEGDLASANIPGNS